MKLSDFEYNLPEELIAQEPVAVRHQSRLMTVTRASGAIEHHQFSALPDLLKPGDLLVVNDTRVIPARLLARRATGGLVEILLLRPEPKKPGVWLAMATPLRKLKPGEKLTVVPVPVATTREGTVNRSADDGTGSQRLQAAPPQSEEEHVLTVDEFVHDSDGHRRLLIDFHSQANVYQLLSKSGFAPLPPYIRRQYSEGEQERRFADLERYQTIFAQAPGAVAAPTAGLHFSEQLYARLRQSGIEIEKVTLHVGPGTFKPISSSLEVHTIEAEEFSISEQTAARLNQARRQGRRIVAVGTTTCRALETACAEGTILPARGASTSLYIKPGFEFKAVDALITNFHLSRSSLLVLVAIFGGYELIMDAYRQAVAEKYRFFSYGDAMLIL